MQGIFNRACCLAFEIKSDENKNLYLLESKRKSNLFVDDPDNSQRPKYDNFKSQKKLVKRNLRRYLTTNENHFHNINEEITFKNPHIINDNLYSMINNNNKNGNDEVNDPKFIFVPNYNISKLNKENIDYKMILEKNNATSDNLIYLPDNMSQTLDMNQIQQFVPYAYERGYAYSIKQIGPPTDNINKLYPNFIKPPNDPPPLPSASLFPAYYPQPLPTLPSQKPHAYFGYDSHDPNIGPGKKYTNRKRKQHRNHHGNKKLNKNLKTYRSNSKGKSTQRFITSKNRWNIDDFDKEEEVMADSTTSKTLKKNQIQSNMKLNDDNTHIYGSVDGQYLEPLANLLGKNVELITNVNIYNHSKPEHNIYDDNLKYKKTIPLKNKDPLSSELFKKNKDFESSSSSVHSIKFFPNVNEYNNKESISKDYEPFISEGDTLKDKKSENQDLNTESDNLYEDEEDFYSPAVYRSDMTTFNSQKYHKEKKYVPYKNINFDSNANKFSPKIFKNSKNKIKNIQVKCDLFKDVMEVKIDFDEGFHGIVYTKGYFKGPHCRSYGSGTKNMYFKFPLDACGTEIKNQKFKGDAKDKKQDASPDYSPHDNDRDDHNTGDIFYFNTIIILNEAKWAILDGLDKAFKISCHVGMEGTKKIESYLRVPMFHTEDTEPFEMTLPEVWMKIVQGSDPYQRGSEILELGNVGSLVVLLHDLSCSYDLYVFNCYAHDGYNQDKVQLIDENGCPMEKNLILPQNVERAQCEKDDEMTKDTLSISSFKIFKFPDQSQVYFECHAKICFYDCYKPKCSATNDADTNELDEFYNQQRRKRQVSRNKKFKNVLNEHLGNITTNFKYDSTNVILPKGLIPKFNKSTDVNLFRAIKVKIRNIEEKNTFNNNLLTDGNLNLFIHYN
ncbi:unnamed protein product [Gordionus sp. m RMFG-2023]